MSVLIKDIQVICTAPEGINLVAVRVDTNQPGLYGLGCATFAYRHLTVKHLIEHYLRPLLVGRDAGNISELWQLMHQNGYWRNGPVVNNAISGIDMALWDIQGKLAGMPLYQLFGGKVRAGVPVYRHADGKDIDELCDNIARFQQLGLTHIRCQVGGYGNTPYDCPPPTAPDGALPGAYLDERRYIYDTVEMFARIRERIGYEVALIHDVHERISPSDAIRLAKELEPYDLFFLEDPIEVEQLGWLRNLRSATVTPIAIGELFNHPSEWMPLISERLIDFIRVHLSQIGGITPARKLQVLAEQFGVRTVWHGPGDMTPIAHAANIHLDLAGMNSGLQEWSGIEPPNVILQKLRTNDHALYEVFPGMPEYREGYVYVNDRPGLGVELDETAAAKYPCDDSVTVWTQTRARDGALQTP